MSAFLVHIFNNIAQEGLDVLREHSVEIINDEHKADAILLRSQSLRSFRPGKTLKAIARAGAGTNNIPVEDMTKHGVVVFNTPGANANAVKELVISCLIMGSRNLFPAVNFVKDLNEEDTVKIEEVKKQFKGFELKGKKLGVIGLGAIGSMVANTAIDLGLEVNGYDPMLTIERALNLSPRVNAVGSLSECISQCDFITLHAPLVKDTTSLINSELLKQMQDDVILLNFARDELVDASAIKSALLNSEIGAYISDFPNKTLLGTPNCHFLPHLGASTVESEVNCAVQAAEELVDFIENGHIRNSVNFPNIQLRRVEGAHRLVILNENVPGALSDIMKLVADDRLNITDMINQSRNDVAATLIDTDKPINPDLITMLEDLPSVIRCYAI